MLQNIKKQVVNNSRYFLLQKEHFFYLDRTEIVADNGKVECKTTGHEDSFRR